ncbi:MAG: hypothetical protein AAF914_07720 [Pseudomonadota bacterium]
MAERRDAPFFIGFAGIPPGLRLPLLLVAAAIIGFFAGMAMVSGFAQDDPGASNFGVGGRQTVTGVLDRSLHYPILHILEGTEQLPAGRSIMISGTGKRGGLIGRQAPPDGAIVVASGALLRRGDLDMVQLRNGGNGLSVAEGDADATAPTPEDLGTWRLAGEICDGKCLAGAMRPGTGLSHRACAELCLVGDVPPVFVSSAPILGETFLMIVGPGGSALPDALYDHIAVFVSIEGQVTRHGDLLVFEVDPETVERVQ